VKWCCPEGRGLWCHVEGCATAHGVRSSRAGGLRLAPLQLPHSCTAVLSLPCHALRYSMYGKEQKRNTCQLQPSHLRWSVTLGRRNLLATVSAPLLQLYKLV
jgi:hypothetical protein